MKIGWVKTWWLVCGMTTAIAPTRLDRRARPGEFGMYRNCAAARRTASFVEGDTRSLPARAIDAVLTDTPARRATSRNVNL
jgi:hypothetical protein